MSEIFERGQSVKEQCLKEWDCTERPKEEVFAFEAGFNACHSKLVIEMMADVNKALKELYYFRENESEFGCITSSFLDDAIETIEKYYLG